MTKKQPSFWTISASITAKYQQAMQEMNNLRYSTSEQHKDLTKSRLERDKDDLKKIEDKLKSCSSFSENPSSRNIVNGVIANRDVAVHEFEFIGKKLNDNMIEQPAFTTSFKLKDKVVTLGDISAVKVAPDRLIDHALML